MVPARSRRVPAAAPPDFASTRPGVPATLAIVAAVAAGVALSARVGWLCDDAFISFRYARHLVDGAGLVFNPGERVEGYSNLLWTLWSALGLAAGADVERWSMAWGVACYAATLALLGLQASWRERRWGTHALPLAMLLTLASSDMRRYATGGLETAAYTLLLVAGYVLLQRRGASARTAAGAGLVMALAAMTRPEGSVLAVVAGAFVAWRARRRDLAAFVLAFLALWGPWMAWRFAYYGDWLPNPWYAKSADLAWWRQGAVYLGLYVRKYPALALAIPAGGLAVAMRRSAVPGAALAAAFALVPAAMVTRLGGDFMFARLLIPATPFLFELLELGAAALLERARAAGVALAGVALAGTLLAPDPLPGTRMVDGIINEWAFYTPAVVRDDDARALAARPFFAGLPAHVAFFGGEARLVYQLDPAWAIESETGLTDRGLAMRPLARRGRIGHEKRATLDELTVQRHAEVTFHPAAPQLLDLPRQIPLVPVTFGPLQGLLLRWDPELVAAWRRRGAQVEDFPATIDREIAELPRHSDAEAAALLGRLDRFYFRFVPDAARRRPFIMRLQRRS